MALTDAAVRAAKSRNKPYKMTDEKGLFLLVQPSGGKLWRYNYAMGSKRKTLSIGQFPNVSLAAAREYREDARRLLNKGIDPSQHKQQTKKAEKAAVTTFKDVAKKVMADARKKKLATVTVDKKEWLLREFIYPEIGNRPVGDLKPADVLRVLKKIEGKGLLETTKRARQIMGQVFRLAAVDELADGDPTHLLRGMVKAPKVVSYPAIVREDQFGELLRDIEGYASPMTRLGLQFLALTFVRTVELRFAKWPEIDLEENVWRIPAERMKMRRPHDVPLCAATRGILKQAKELNPYSWEEDGYIFASATALRKPTSENTLNAALWRMGYKGRHTGHGFRSSANTMLNERGVAREKVIEFQLAHLEENEVKRAYNRASYWDERVKLMRDWAAICAELRDGKPSRAGDGPSRERAAQL